MKKLVFCFLLLYPAIKSLSQEKVDFSLEVDANYYHYFFGDNYSNNLNYGFSVLPSLQVHKLKLSAGVNYSTKSYDSNQESFYSIRKLEYDLQYLNFPILANIRLYSHDKFHIGILAGVLFNDIIDYRIKKHELNGGITTETQLLNNRKKLGSSLMVGAVLSKLIGPRCQLNVSPFINLRLQTDHFDQRPGYDNIPEDKVLIGFKVGLERLF